MPEPPPRHRMSKETENAFMESIHEVYPEMEIQRNKDALDPTKPPEHIAQVPAGFKRDEEMRRREDDLQQKAEEATNLGEGDRMSTIDPAKLRQQDNEIMRYAHLEGRASGSCPVTNPVPGYRYLWVPQWDHGGSEVVLAHLHRVRTELCSYRYERVEGNMPECADMKAIGGVRRWGDCVLYRIKEEDYQLLAEYRQILIDRQNRVEQAFANYGMQYAGRLGGNMAHGDPRDPMIQRTIFAGVAGQQVAIEREIRTGRVILGGRH